jgi:hypothetical protein
VSEEGFSPSRCAPSSSDTVATSGAVTPPHGIPLGLIASFRALLSTALTLPKLAVVNPAPASIRFASTTDCRRSRFMDTGYRPGTSACVWGEAHGVLGMVSCPYRLMVCSPPNLVKSESERTPNARGRPGR